MIVIIYNSNKIWVIKGVCMKSLKALALLMVTTLGIQSIMAQKTVVVQPAKQITYKAIYRHPVRPLPTEDVLERPTLNYGQKERIIGINTGKNLLFKGDTIQGIPFRGFNRDMYYIPFTFDKSMVEIDYFKDNGSFSYKFLKNQDGSFTMYINDNYIGEPLGELLGTKTIEAFSKKQRKSIPAVVRAYKLDVEEIKEPK